MSSKASKTRLCKECRRRLSECQSSPCDYRQKCKEKKATQDQEYRQKHRWSEGSLGGGRGHGLHEEHRESGPTNIPEDVYVQRSRLAIFLLYWNDIFLKNVLPSSTAKRKEKQENAAPTLIM